MKKHFFTPEAEMIPFDPQDIIRTSNGPVLETKASDDEEGFGDLILP